MKRILPIVLILLLLTGCSTKAAPSSNAVTFYYLKQEYTFGQDGQCIAPEQWETAGQRRDLFYIMSMYLVGPSEEGHVSPLPNGTRISCSTRENGGIQLELSEAARNLSDIEFSLACSCLSMTCFDIAETPEVTVINGERSITLTPDKLILIDNNTSRSITEDPQ